MFDGSGDATSTDAYLRPAFRPRSLDSAVSRRAILSFLEQETPSLTGTVLDVGCGHQPYRSLLTAAPGVDRYVGLDLPPTRYQRPDVVWEGTAMPLRTSSVDSAVATELLEHVPDPLPLLREVRRVLRPGGRLLLTVPFLWPLHDVPDDELRYTPFRLERILGDAGFTDVSLRAMGGWDASLAQLLGLWVRRRPMGRARKPLSWAATPVVAALARRDRPPARFGESTMITGIAGHAVKPHEPSPAT